MSHLQDCIMDYLRQHPEGATAKATAEGIDSEEIRSKLYTAKFGGLGGDR